MKKTIPVLAAIGAVAVGAFVASQKPKDEKWTASLAEARRNARPAADCFKPTPAQRAVCARLFPDAGTP